MFNAIRDANKGVTNSPWAQRPQKISAQVPVNTNGTETLAYLSENGGVLAQKLAKSGAKTVVYSPNAKTDFLLIDGSSEPNPIAVGAMKIAADKVLSEGGTVWVWDIRPSAAAALSKVFDQEITVAPRVASSFVVKQNDALLAGLDNAALYFSEGDDWQQISYALDGAFVKGAQVVLEACPVDWRRWSYRSEQVKTASIFRSEVENPGPLAAIVIRPMDKGRVILCNLNPEIRTTKKSAIMQRLFSNEGVQIEQVAGQGGFMDAGGHLTRALVCGSFSVTNMDEAYTGKAPSGEIRENGRFEGHRWMLHDADSAGVFDLKNDMVRGDLESAYAYIAVWIKSSKPLNDLLSEPNLPKLSFTYGSDDGCEVFLNGELLSSHRREGPLETEGFSENPLLLKLGWNQLVIKVVQGTGEWKFAGKFGCSDLGFLQKLEFAAEKPATGGE
jgi:hypothetical protein